MLKSGSSAVQERGACLRAASGKVSRIRIREFPIPQGHKRPEAPERRPRHPLRALCELLLTLPTHLNRILLRDDSGSPIHKAVHDRWSVNHRSSACEAPQNLSRGGIEGMHESRSALGTSVDNAIGNADCAEVDRAW